MDQSLYIQFKTFLSQYPLSDEDTFYTLHRAYKPHMNRRQFVRYCRNMGVSSDVVRRSGVVRRVLTYDPKADQYLLKLFPVFGQCPKCEGTGVVKVNVKKTIDNI